MTNDVNSEFEGFELFRSVHNQVTRNGWGASKRRRVINYWSGKISIGPLAECSGLRQKLRRIARRKGSILSSRLLSTPLITLALRPLGLLC